MIINGLRHRLMAPELVEEFVLEPFEKEINLQRRDDQALHDIKKRELTDVTRKLNGLIDAIADGLRAPGLQQRLDELEARRVAQQDLATRPTTPVRLHPNLAQVYRRQVERLQEPLNEPEIRDEALQVLRGLVERISIGTTENGLEVEIVGEIAKMVELGTGNQAEPDLWMRR